VLRLTVKLLAVGAVLNAALNVVPPFFHYAKFQDAVRETARFSARATEKDVVDKVMRLADENEIPIDREDVRVTKIKERTHVAIAYSEDLYYVPTQAYRWDFVVDVEGVPPPRELLR